MPLCPFEKITLRGIGQRVIITCIEFIKIKDFTDQKEWVVERSVNYRRCIDRYYWKNQK